uniref:Uncharacterized protein n=1 Tax=Panagrolaimus sp. PS1159 TaxID=55785 RepID=A0AC35G5N9_9BILA
MKNEPKPSARRSTIRRVDVPANGTEQSIPLINLIPNRVSLSPAEPFTTRHRLKIFHPSKIDLYSRFVFPIFFLLFNIGYWSVYLNV